MNNKLKEALKEYRKWIRKLEKVYYAKYQLALKNSTIINWKIHISIFEDNLKEIKDIIEVIESESSSDIEELTIIIGNCIYAISKILFEIDKEIK
jgi:hypothetical protein